MQRVSELAQPETIWENAAEARAAFEKLDVLLLLPLSARMLVAHAAYKPGFVRPRVGACCTTCVWELVSSQTNSRLSTDEFPFLAPLHAASGADL
eukprot:5041282-Pleurochrysis_carterae.AAC.8